MLKKQQLLDQFHPNKKDLCGNADKCMKLKEKTSECELTELLAEDKLPQNFLV